MPRIRPAPGLINQHEAIEKLGISGRQFRRWCRRHGVRPLHTRYGSAQEHLYDGDALHHLWRLTHPRTQVPGPAETHGPWFTDAQATQILADVATGPTETLAAQFRDDLVAAFEAGMAAAAEAAVRVWQDRRGR